MGWYVTQNGLEVRLSRAIPDVARHRVRRVTDEFLASVGLELADIDDFICHPGGARVLEALEDAFGLPSGGLAASREILRDYGNMSTATVLFILKRALVTGAADNGRHEGARRYLMTALGPGSVIISLVDACDVWRKLLTAEELARARKRIELVSRPDLIGRAVATLVRIVRPAARDGACCTRSTWSWFRRPMN